MKEGPFDERPDGGRASSGVEVSQDVPVAALEVTDGSVAVPTFVGVRWPVHQGEWLGKSA